MIAACANRKRRRAARTSVQEGRRLLRVLRRIPRTNEEEDGE
ncbi:hypothetical protein SGRIM128S_07558 [Streptomyces griseomycini]